MDKTTTMCVCRIYISYEITLITPHSAYGKDLLLNDLMLQYDHRLQSALKNEII